MSEKHSILSRLREQLDLPADIVPGDSQIMISGNRELTVNGHCGIGAYGQEEIHVRIRHGIAVVSGHKLEISRMNPVSLVIRGEICDVSLEVTT